MLRVDNVPWYLKVPYWLYGYGCGLIAYGYFTFARWTSRTELVGEENLAAAPSAIMAMWHTENIPCFVADFFRRTNRRHAMINHPAWYMKPVHVILKLQGVKCLILGSTGHDGRRAADELVGYLRDGWSTHLNPDGPGGPVKRLKKGVAHIACQSGVPIIPVKFLVSREKVLRGTWDQKRVPLPFATIRIVCGKPIRVTPEQMEHLLPTIAVALS